MVLVAAFAKLRKATVSFVVSVRPSACLPAFRYGTARLPWAGIHEILCLKIFRKSIEKLRLSLKSVKN